MVRHYYKLNGQVVSKVCDSSQGICKFVSVDLSREDDNPVQIIIEDL